MKPDSEYRILATSLFCALQIVYLIGISSLDWFPAIDPLAMALIRLSADAESVFYVVPAVIGLLTWLKSRDLR